MITVNSITEDSWQLWRALRLAALSESPQAFRSTLAEWSGVNDQESRWRNRLKNSALSVLAFDGHLPVGMAACTPAEQGVSEIVSMWVDPHYRGHGVGDKLLEAVTQWATNSQQIKNLILHVKSNNLRAKELYIRAGFLEPGSALWNQYHCEGEVTMIKQIDINAT